MATLGDMVRLTTIEKSSSFIGIERNTSPEAVTVTTGSQHIRVYDLRDTRPQRSWASRAGDALTSAAVVDFSSNSYVAVLDRQKIRCWSEEDTNFDKAKKKTAPKPVHQVISAHGAGPLIVYSDGTLAWLSNIKESFGQALEGNSKIVGVCKAVYTGKKLWLVIIVRSEGLNTMTRACVYPIEKDSVSVQPKHVDITDIYTSQENVSLHVSGTTPSLLILDKKGVLTDICLEDQSIGERSNLQPLSNITETSAIESVSTTHVAVAGITVNDAVGFGIWDAKFGILHDWKKLPRSSSEQLRLFSTESHLVLLCGGVIYAAPYTAKPATLIAALGKFSTTGDSLSKNKTSDNVLSTLLDDLHKAGKKASPELYEKTLQRLQELQTKKNEFPLVQHQVAAFVNKCISESNHWPEQELHYLIKKNMVPPSLSTAVVHSLCLKKDIRLLHTCLLHLKEIPEAALVECLGCFLSSHECTYNGMNLEEEESSTPGFFSRQKETIIQSVLAQPYNEVFLVDCLKTLEFSSALSLLGYLHHVLTCSSVSDKEDRLSKTLTSLKVVEWCSMLLDAHFTQMVLATDARQILVDLHQEVEQQVAYCDDLVGLQAILSGLKEKCVLPKKQHPGLYNIHVLHVR